MSVASILNAELNEEKLLQMPLEQEIRAYEARKEELERHHNGKYVVFHGDALVGIYDSLDAAAQAAIEKYGRGPYLIRQIGESTPTTMAHIAHLNMRPVGANG